MAVLARINLFPIKSLDGIAVNQCAIVSPGALENDRRYCLVDQRGEWINGKRTFKVHLLRASFDLARRQVELATDGATACSFTLPSQQRELATWLTAFFEEPVFLQENPDGGFPDDTESPGPTVVSTATLTRVAEWFGLRMEEVRARFRANLEIDGVPAFWEDHLVAEVGRVVRFRIGEVVLEGTNPCQRCPVPGRNPWTGEEIDRFVPEFNRRRREELPDWACSERFDHHYRLAVNTRVAPASWNHRLHVGDAVEIIGTA
jgi:uncharacterized protein YcbX